MTRDVVEQNLDVVARIQLMTSNRDVSATCSRTNQRPHSAHSRTLQSTTTIHDTHLPSLPSPSSYHYSTPLHGAATWRDHTATAARLHCTVLPRGVTTRPLQLVYIARCCHVASPHSHCSPSTLHGAATAARLYCVSLMTTVAVVMVTL